MKVGDLVNITRRAIGVPAGTFGLITEKVTATDGTDHFYVDMYLADDSRRETTRRWLGRDLEVMNG